MRIKQVVVFGVLLAAFVPSIAMSASERANRISTHQDWTAYQFNESGSPVCYVVSQPKKAEGNYTRRGDIFAFVTHRPAANELNVISFLAGYTYKQGESVTVEFDGSKSFTLFTQDDRSWAPDAATDRQILNAMRGGREMVVKGTSSRGTQTTDTYSLMGVSAAVQAIDKACR